MIAKNVTLDQLWQAAREVRVELYNVRASGRGWAFTLRPSRAHVDRRFVGERYRKLAPYHRRSVDRPFHGSTPRAVWAVCWHGHRDFFRAMYRLAPDAVVRTAIAVYRGSDGFEQTFPDTAFQNVGSVMMPVDRADCCWCDETGEGRTLAEAIADRLSGGVTVEG